MVGDGWLLEAQAPLKDYRGYFFNGHPRIVA
jgi:hypothetical protein